MRNFERKGQYVEALRVTLQLDMPNKALGLVRRLLDEGLAPVSPALRITSASSAEPVVTPLAACIAALDDDLLSRLLLFVRDWHATRVIHFVLFLILTTIVIVVAVLVADCNIHRMLL